MASLNYLPRAVGMVHELNDVLRHEMMSHSQLCLEDFYCTIVNAAADELPCIYAADLAMPSRASKPAHRFAHSSRLPVSRVGSTLGQGPGTLSASNCTYATLAANRDGAR